jgi:hypothetical protein
MNFQKRFPPDDDIWTWSNPLIAQQNAIRFYGSSAILYKSKVKGKKYAIRTPEGKLINFGALNYEDYTKHKDPARRANFLARTSRGQTKGYSANALSRNILW